MRIDTAITWTRSTTPPRPAVEAERSGFDGWTAIETKADPFLSAAVAAERTEGIELLTGIAVAFARNPMTVALQANDVQAVSGGRCLRGPVHPRPRIPDQAPHHAPVLHALE
jgi:alkanesulfonate monooxygenase SsuD/methylene tetrahydromethanopterin reductase-like flavin-dependent oxidoreductase (luciferase family)